MAENRKDIESVLLRLPIGTLDRVQAALRPGETRSDFLRALVEDELERRSGRKVVEREEKVRGALEAISKLVDEVLKEGRD